VDNTINGDIYGDPGTLFNTKNEGPYLNYFNDVSSLFLSRDLSSSVMPSKHTGEELLLEEYTPFSPNQSLVNKQDLFDPKPVMKLQEEKKNSQPVRDRQDWLHPPPIDKHDRLQKVDAGPMLIENPSDTTVMRKDDTWMRNFKGKRGDYLPKVNVDLVVIFDKVFVLIQVKDCPRSLRTSISPKYVASGL